ncbi:MAG: glycosyltransferase family 4 protein [Alphaproteobacteria bacterium]
MKIAQLCAVDFSLRHFLLPLMRALRDAGHEAVGICAEGPLLADVRAAGFRVETVPFERSFDLRAHRRAYRALLPLLARERFDIVHTHTPIASVIGRMAARKAAVPRIVYTAHGFYFHERMPGWKRAPFVALERYAGRMTDVLFTQSQEDAETARRLRLCRTGDVQAIGNGVDPATFGPDPAVRARVRRDLGVGDDRPVIMMTGRLVAEKGYPELIAAMRAVDAALWIVGERLASDHASSVAAALAAAEADPVLRGRVRLLGDRKDVPDLLRGADIFTLPSHREGMPRSIIEAMMTGLAVVATDIRGSREEVVAEETGLLVPVGDADRLAAALARLAGDPALRARMGAAGRTRALDLYDEAKVIDRQLRHLGLA